MITAMWREGSPRVRSKMTCSPRLSTRKSGASLTSRTSPRDQPLPRGMESGDRDLGTVAGHERLDPSPHLARRLASERKGQDLCQSRRLPADQPGNPSGAHRGLAGPRLRGGPQESSVVAGRLAVGAVQTGTDRVVRLGCDSTCRGYRPSSRPTHPAPPALGQEDSCQSFSRLSRPERSQPTLSGGREGISGPQMSRTIMRRWARLSAMTSSTEHDPEGREQHRRFAVITGLGVVAPIGVGLNSFWKSALAGHSGIGSPTQFNPKGLPKSCQMVGEVRGFDPEQWSASARHAGRFSQFAVAATKMALQDSGLDASSLAPERLLVSIGTSMNGLVDVHEPSFSAFLRGEDVVPWTVLEYPAHSATSRVAMTTGARGQTASFATACAAGLDAIAWAADRVTTGEATAVIAGGTDTPLSRYTLTAFHRVGVLSEWTGPPSSASRPFDKLRSGLVLGEGAAIVIVEDEEHALNRRARIYARILGVGSGTEGEHLRKVDLSGATVARVVTAALQRSGLVNTDIDYVSAHGNSMIDYDIAETAGLKSALGRHAWNVPVSSIKSMCGHALGAAGALQAVTACLVIHEQCIPPTINYDNPDPKCDLDYVPNTMRVARVRHLVIHAHSMGGSHTALIMGAPA